MKFLISLALALTAFRSSRRLAISLSFSSLLMLASDGCEADPLDGDAALVESTSPQSSFEAMEGVTDGAGDGFGIAGASTGADFGIGAGGGFCGVAFFGAAGWEGGLT